VHRRKVKSKFPKKEICEKEVIGDLKVIENTGRAYDWFSMVLGGSESRDVNH
jgi:hypothetical protein